MVKDKGKKAPDGEKEIKIEDFSKEGEIPATYGLLVSDRLKKREGNVMSKLDEMLEDQLRFTVRIFADCMEEEDMRTFLKGYSEYMVDDDLRKFVGEFVPKYTEYAISELESKKGEAEDFEAKKLTGEELQEMAIKEKWPILGKNPGLFSPLRLRREIAKLALCFRPYMLSDPGWNESLLEYSLYFDLQEALAPLPEKDLHDAASRLASKIAGAEEIKGVENKEEILADIRATVLKFAGIEGAVEEHIGPQMERYPGEAPEGWDLAEFRNSLEKLNLAEVRMSALVYMDMLTLKEMEELTKPFMEKHKSFFDMDRGTLIELICTLLYAIGDREILNFYERYSKGKMMVGRTIARETWNLLPVEHKLKFLREDNGEMDLAIMARHVARIYLSDKYFRLYDYDFHIDLVKEENYLKTQGLLVHGLGGRDEGRSLRALNDEVTVTMLDIVTTGERMKERFQVLREKIAGVIGLSHSNDTNSK